MPSPRPSGKCLIAPLPLLVALTVGAVLRLEMARATPPFLIANDSADYFSGGLTLVTGGVLLARVGAQQAVAGQRLRDRVVPRDRLLDQPHDVIPLGPGMEAVPGQATPPHLVLEAQSPGRMSRSQPDQAVARTFC